MTERDYQSLLDTVQDAIDAEEDNPGALRRPQTPSAANDNGVEWGPVPFPKGWQASP